MGSIILILIIVGVLWHFKSKGNKKQLATTPIGESGDDVVKEALTVVNDFLNIGSDASLFTDSSSDFRGHIIFTPDARPPFSGNKVNYGFYIKLSDVSDLRIGARKYPKMLTNNPDIAERFHAFIGKYGNNHVASEGGYVYRTKRTVALHRGQEGQLHAKLGQQIAEKCPLADFSGNLLYTKNVYRD